MTTVCSLSNNKTVDLDFLKRLVLVFYHLCLHSHLHPIPPYTQISVLGPNSSPTTS